MTDRLTAYNCPALKTVRDKRDFGAQDEQNALVLDFVKKGMIDHGMIANAELYFAANPGLGETVVIGADTYTFELARTVAFTVTRGGDVDASITNLVAAMAEDGTENIYGYADTDNNKLIISNAESPQGSELPGTQDIALSETLANVGSVWNHANLNETGRAEYPYYALIRVEATTENIANDFTIETEFDVEHLQVFLPLKEDTVDVVTGVNFIAQSFTHEVVTYAVACTADVTSDENIITFDLDDGAYPCEAGDIIYVIAAGSEMHT